MLNAFGMKPKQINMIITLQSFFYILKSILISFIFSFTISYILTLLLIMVMVDGFHWQLNILFKYIIIL